MNQENGTSRRWAIVLAGGDGQRMVPFITRWLGRPRPKQYCAFAGRRTMLEHTCARALDSVPAERIVTVVNRDHRRFLSGHRRRRLPGAIVEQPERRDTGPGVFLPLARVVASDPEALVAIMPSDHFIRPRAAFREKLEEAFRLAEFLPGQIVLLAARPDAPEPDYGWIVPGSRLAGEAVLVRRFKEKPAPEEAAELHARGGLWNTMIVVARAAALWDLAREFQPAMIERFDALRWWMGREEQDEAVALAYRGMPSVNFSRGVLEPAAPWTVALPMTGVEWSDWGRPERIVETLEEMGRTRRFPAEALRELAPAAAEPPRELAAA
ncbi:MAG: NTP transferase domain-containing protein [Elusimicrobia bacterium]|nr:NTP transferase domain-containing protein [Elusimicrobiota bacterium]